MSVREGWPDDEVCDCTTETLMRLLTVDFALVMSEDVESGRVVVSLGSSQAFGLRIVAKQLTLSGNNTSTNTSRPGHSLKFRQMYRTFVHLTSSGALS